LSEQHACTHRVLPPTGRHVPYRDSKLTSILQRALGGKSKTAIICTVTLAADHFDESHGTLEFATRAKKVVNEDWTLGK
jgi:hypothetical protein